MEAIKFTPENMPKIKAKTPESWHATLEAVAADDTQWGFNFYLVVEYLAVNGTTIEGYRFMTGESLYEEFQYDGVSGLTEWTELHRNNQPILLCSRTQPPCLQKSSSRY
jgi:hypothetical protein